LYDKIPNLLCPTGEPIITFPTRLGSNFTDGIIHFVNQQSKGSFFFLKILRLWPYKIHHLNVFLQKYEINVVESTDKTKSTGSKNKGKGKSKQNASSKEKLAKDEPIDKK